MMRAEVSDRQLVRCWQNTAFAISRLFGKDSSIAAAAVEFVHRHLHLFASAVPVGRDAPNTPDSRRDDL